jgi:hypothetical protein
MRRFSRWLGALAVLALSACSGSSGGGGGTQCSDACPSSGATQCSGTQLETCQAGADGCLAWSAPAACPAGQACSPAISSCVVVCTSACPSSGATRCSGTQVQTCTAGTNGCLAWSAAASCPGALACDAGLNACAALVTLAWSPNRESGVNTTGGGYELQISGQQAVLVPFVSGPAAPTTADVRVSSGSHTVVVRAFAALDPLGGTTRTFSAASDPIVVNVP